jgi:hypothetical protein
MMDDYGAISGMRILREETGVLEDNLPQSHSSFTNPT